jgi:site-specific DNA-methyltransferase (adenine-specific)
MMIERIGLATLYLGDCLEVLPTLGKMDAVVMDPPYEIGDAWKGGFAGKRGGTSQWDGIQAWDRLQPEAVAMAISMAPKAVVWGGHLYALPQRSKWLIWDKCQKFSFGDAELAWTSERGAIRTFRMSRIDAYANIGETKQHPAQKPVPLMKWCLQEVQAAGTICDPFMGGGSTGVAAVQMGLSFVGIEIEEKYFDIACERIDNAQRQTRLIA